MRPGVSWGVLGYPWVSWGVLGYPGVSWGNQTDPLAAGCQLFYRKIYEYFLQCTVVWTNYFVSFFFLFLILQM